MDVDPVVREMRRHGAEIADACGGDIHRMAKRFREEQAKGSRHIVRRQVQPVKRHKTDPKA